MTATTTQVQPKLAPATGSAPANRPDDRTAPHRPRIQTGVLLIGTARTVATLRDQLASMEHPLGADGCLIVGPRGGAAGASLGIPVLGSAEDLDGVQSRYRFRRAIVCLPASMARRADALRDALARRDLPASFVPTIDELLDAEPTPPHPAPVWRATPRVDLATLIGRDPHEIDRLSVARMLKGRRVLITGAGGSIGSELARVAAAFEPELLILMDRSENALFEIDRQLSERFGGVGRQAMLHDVVDGAATLREVRRIRPHVIFHAAAHKHVPLMEDHPAHAITNNLFGTKAIADAAVECGVERFVMISSDKAVNPTSVMGATKRLAEVYVRSLATPSCPTRMCMVRFGNVLGSACSVLTIWSAQIADGGPITITDPRMTRYFMTIPEAATLVVQSATMTPEDGRAPVFVLDMGEPVRIVDLAARFARAHGLRPRFIPPKSGAVAVRGLAEPNADEPGADSVDVVFTSIRPGEKLHEQLAYDAERLEGTCHPGIRAWSERGSEDEDPAGAMIEALDEARGRLDRASVVDALRKFVPELGAVSEAPTARRRAV